MTLFDALTEILAGVSKLRTTAIEEKKTNAFHPGAVDKQMARLAMTSIREIYNDMVVASGGVRRRGPRKAQQGQPDVRQMPGKQQKTA